MRYIAMGLVMIYRKFISPLFPPKCKYYPTCSAYAMGALKRYGFFRGTALSVWRLLRCNPWSMGGIDPVPDRFTFRARKFNFPPQESSDAPEEEKDEDDKLTD